MDIPREQWRSRLDQFSKDHDNDMVTIEVDSREEGHRLEVSGRAFEGVAADDRGGEHAISIFSGRTEQDHMAHVIARPKRLSIEGDALTIESEDGDVTHVRLHGRESGRNAA